jgi:hypothetical protein
MAASWAGTCGFGSFSAWRSASPSGAAAARMVKGAEPMRHIRQGRRDGTPAQWPIADAAFDADGFRHALAAAGTVAVIPSHPARAHHPA